VVLGASYSNTQLTISRPGSLALDVTQPWISSPGGPGMHSLVSFVYKVIQPGESASSIVASCC
jgi:hypothetical protein